MFFRLCSRAPLTEIESAICESLAGASLELIYEDIYLYRTTGRGASPVGINFQKGEFTLSEALRDIQYY